MRETKYNGSYLSISEEQIDDVLFERVTIRPGVRVFGIRDDKILLIKEYRKNEGRSRWRFISGWIDKEDKTPLDHAVEELAEEACMQSNEWEEFYVSTSHGGTVEEDRHYFIARNPQSMGVCPVNPDTIDTVESTKWVDIVELQEMIDNKEMLWSTAVLIALQALKAQDT